MRAVAIRGLNMAGRCILVVLFAAAAFQPNFSLGEQWLEAFQNDTASDWSSAVQAGMQQDLAYNKTVKYPSYVARLYCNSNIIPAKAEIDVDTNRTTTAWGTWGTSNSTCSADTFEVLIASSNTVISWIPAANGDVPDGATQSGVLSSGEPLFTCRVMDLDNFGLVSGTLRPRSKSCFISYSGTKNYTTYEVLVVKET